MVPICFVALAAASFAHPVFAQQGPVATPASVADEAAGRAAFERGFQALQARRFGEAEVALREAMRLRPTPVTAYNLALALRAIGRYVDAVEVFERYLREPEPGASPERLEAIRGEVASIQRSIARVGLTLRPATAALRVDGRPARPDASGLRLDPGMHGFDVEADGFERDRREVTLAPGARVDLVIALRPLPSEGRVIVEPTVANAAVYIDAQLLGRGRVERTVAPGDHVVEVRAAGHDLWRRTVRVTARATLRLDASPTRTAQGTSRPWLLPVAIGGGALVAAGVVTAIVLATRGDEPLVTTNWGNFRVP